MNSKLRFALTIFGVVLAIFLMWYFSTITTYIIVASVLAMIVSPMTEWLAKRKIHKNGQHHLFPRWLATLLTLMLVLIVFSGFIFLIVPLIIKEAGTIAKIDPQQLSHYSTGLLDSFNQFIEKHGWAEGVHNMEEEVINKLKSMMNLDVVGSAFTGVFSFISSFFMAIFSIIFLTFFFLKDKEQFKAIFLSIFPKSSQYKITNVLSKTKSLLSRYFIGLLIQLTAVIILEFIGLIAFDIPNALLIAFIGGFMNIIPYIGPLIGGAIGVILAVISTLATGVYDGIGWIALKVILVFVIANIIDNSVNQPLIFSKSVNAHPVEIFIVVLAAGFLGGIGAMVIAIPAYTVLRIILKEYLSEFSFINNLTKNI